ncbi:MAG: M23 family metallopeptidase, partial [Candidatus Zixiibacteriota bacterium]
MSSGFGDFRQDHFHFGVDLRTGGAIGKRVLSPVDGYVMRVRTSYRGYGKALYIKGDDGYIYVFGHLSNFTTKIDQPLKAAQLAARRYYQDLTFPP